MKYFTKELWEGLNTEDDALFRQADEQWECNREAYFRQLQQVKTRLSKSAARFFGSVSLHDGRLLAFVSGDHVGYRESELSSVSRNKGRPEVRMHVLDFEQRWLHSLSYAKVRKVLFDFPSDHPLFYEEGGRIADWGYDELTDAGDSYLRHEVLFSSGTTILIEFQRFSYKRTRVVGSKGTVF
ncbi:MAG: hypothetical protein ACJ741_19730 [Pyrinomonadaceae bacterium]